MFSKSNKQFFDEACQRAKVRSQGPDYKGCSVHVNAKVGMRDGEPKIVGYDVADWFDGHCTVRTYVNGKER